MKNKILNILLILGFVSFFSACEKEEVEAPFVFRSSTMESTLSNVAFAQENADAEFVTLEWEAVDFGPSKTVNYSVEIAAAGTDFADPMDIVTTTGLAKTLTVGELNLVLARLGFEIGSEASVDIRVRSWVDYLIAPAVTNPLTVTLTPYLVVFPPLHVIGDARPGGWGLTNGLELVSHSPGIYEGEGIFLKDGQFRFFYELDWGAAQVRATDFTGGTLDSDLEPVGDGDGNIRFLGLSGTYKIKVDLNAPSITIDPAGPPPPPASLFLVTPQTLDLNTAIEFPSAQPGVYENTIVLAKNTKFRFFTERNWNKEKWGYNYFETVDSDLGDSGDDVSNFVFLSEESEYYKITITAETKTITVEPASPPFPATLLVNGDPYGWNFTNAAVLLSTSVGTYQGMIKVTNGSFRFFSTNDWVQPQWGYDDFTTVPGVFTDGGGGDHNLVHSSGTRYYKITVSLINKTITLADPVLYVIGDDQGWNLGNAFPLTWQSGGTFQGTTTFTNNSIFRFFITPAWGQPKNELNFTSFTTVDSDFTNGGGGDQNLRFNGTTGSHTITVDLINSSVVIN
jgi:hypothetical protein